MISNRKGIFNYEKIYRRASDLSRHLHSSLVFRQTLSGSGRPRLCHLNWNGYCPIYKGKGAFPPRNRVYIKENPPVRRRFTRLRHELIRGSGKGRQSLPIILATITTSILIAVLLFRLLKIPTKSAILIGVGSSICGGSAIAATAPVIEADDEEIAQSISVIFLFNIAAALIFPALGTALGLSNEGFGLFAGTAINDTSSVTAAAAAWDGIYGSNTLEAAAIVKLTRTLAIIPITLFLAFYRTKKEQSGSGNTFQIAKIFPFFVLFFLLASVLTTVFHLPATVTGPLKDLSKFFIIMAMAAIGTNTNLVTLVKTGMKPILLGLCCWIGISLVSLSMQSFLGIW